MNKSLMLGSAVSLLLDAGYFAGLLLVFQKSLAVMYRRVAVRKRLHTQKHHVQSFHPLTRHLHFLLNATLDKPWSFQLFLFWCLGLMVLLTTVALQSFHPVTAVCIGGAGALAPYLMLRLRLETRRRRGSLEGETVVSELLRQYRICGKNIYEALEHMIPEIRECKICCRLLHRMLLRLRNTGNPLEIREAVNVFSYAVGTNWSCMLAGCIRIGAERGCDVSMGLEDVMIQMRQARSRMEERRRMNSEAMRLTLFMVPLLYLSTVLLSVYYLEVPLTRFVRNQIGTPEGMLMLLLIGFLFLLNLALLEIVNNQKLDY